MVHAFLCLHAYAFAGVLSAEDAIAEQSQRALHLAELELQLGHLVVQLMLQHLQALSCE